MAEQPQLPDSVTPAQFFEELMPMGFAAQAQENNTPRPDFKIQFRLTGDGGGDWIVELKDGKMTGTKGVSDTANLTVTLTEKDWRDAALGRNGASLGLIIPQPRPGRPDNSARAMALKGTMALELARDGDPFKVEMCFNNAAAPRTLLKMKLQEYLDMQTGKLNGQEAFMTGKIKVEGDMGFLMQIAALNM